MKVSTLKAKAGFIQSLSISNFILKGNSYIKVINDRKYRFKFNSISIRFERYSNISKQWIRIGSVYYCDLNFNLDTFTWNGFKNYNEKSLDISPYIGN